MYIFLEMSNIQKPSQKRKKKRMKELFIKQTFQTKGGLWWIECTQAKDVVLCVLEK